MESNFFMGGEFTPKQAKALPQCCCLDKKVHYDTYLFTGCPLFNTFENDMIIKSKQILPWLCMAFGAQISLAQVHNRNPSGIRYVLEKRFSECPQPPAPDYTDLQNWAAHPSKIDP